MFHKNVLNHTTYDFLQGLKNVASTNKRKKMNQIFEK